MKTVLVTGSAGFIGFHLVNKLLEEGYRVIGLDNINDYYDVNLKYARLAETGIYSSDETDFTGGKKRNYTRIEFHHEIKSVINERYSFYRANLEDKEYIFSLFEKFKFDYVINLAAQAGVRYSLENPDVYVQSNVVGFLNVLEACRQFPVKHFVYASSSSIYGNNAKIPFSTDDRTDTPVSLYAATKKTNELMAHTYSHLYRLPTTGLRFFTVYGPWGRPDMAPMLFAKAIIKGESIKVFNNGNMKRDFTYVEDIVEGTYRTLISENLQSSFYHIFNIGNGKPINLIEFIETMEITIGKEARKELLPMQDGDVEKTWADLESLTNIICYRPQTNIRRGVLEFVQWYNDFFI